MQKGNNGPEKRLTTSVDWDAANFHRYNVVWKPFEPG